MHQKQWRRLARLESGDDAVDGGLRGIDRRDDTPDGSAVGYLETVDRVGLVGNLPDPEILVEVFGDPGERDGHHEIGHPARRGRTGGAAASMLLGRGAATRVPWEIESA